MSSTISKALLPLFILASLLGVDSVDAQLSFFQTTLTLVSPVQNGSAIDSVLYRWSTFEQQGGIGEEDLQDFTMELRANGTRIYSDRVLAGGVVLPLGGQERALDTDLFWDFDLDGLALIQMRNSATSTMEMSSGEHFLVGDSLDLVTDGVVTIAKYQDGILVGGGGSESLQVQRTEPVIFYDGFESGDLIGWSESLP